MDEADSPDLRPESSIEEEQHFIRGAAKRAIQIIGENKRKAAAGTAAVAIGLGGAEVIATQLPSTPAPKADVPYNSYGKEGVPKPSVEVLSNGVVAKINFNHTKNLAEKAQEIEWLIDRGELPDRVWNGAVKFPTGTLLQRAPYVNYEAGARVVPEGKMLLVQRPRIYTDPGQGPSWAIIRLEDSDQSYWINLEDAYQLGGVQGLAYASSDPDKNPSLFWIQNARINARGNLEIKNQANVPADDIASGLLIDGQFIDSKEKELNLVPTTAKPYY